MRTVARRPKQRGDVFDLTTNVQHILREVRSVANGVVSYTSGGVFRQCRLSEFRRWARSAEVFSSDNWRPHEEWEARYKDKKAAADRARRTEKEGTR